MIQGYGKTILFDTGGDGEILLENMSTMGIEAGEIDSIIISHGHHDHCGGLIPFLKVNHSVTVFLPRSLCGRYRARVESLGADVVPITGFQEIRDRVYTTGEMGSFLKEQSLILSTSTGLVIITGCAHPGVTHIVKRARDHFSRPVSLLAGGFHLLNASREKICGIMDSLQQMEVKKVAPSHCTGQRAISAFQSAWGDDCIPGGCGSVIPLE